MGPSGKASQKRKRVTSKPDPMQSIMDRLDQIEAKLNGQPALPDDHVVQRDEVQIVGRSGGPPSTTTSSADQQFENSHERQPDVPSGAVSQSCGLAGPSSEGTVNVGSILPAPGSLTQQFDQNHSSGLVMQPSPQELNFGQSHSSGLAAASTIRPDSGTGMEAILFPQQVASQADAFGRNLGVCLDLKTKTKIWADEYVDFNTLFNNTAEPIQISFSSGNPSSQDRTAVLNKPKSKELTFFQWLSAFTVFAHVKGQKSKDEAHDLWTYLQGIIDMYNNFPASPAWRMYDQDFRRHRATNPTIHPWKVINWHYYNKAVMGNLSSLAAAAGRTSQKGKSNAVCYDYNNTGFCNNQNCRYLHACFACGAKHPRLNCWKQQRNNQRTPFRSNTQQPGSQGKDGTKSNAENQQGTKPRQGNNTNQK